MLVSSAKTIKDRYTSQRMKTSIWPYPVGWLPMFCDICSYFSKNPAALNLSPFISSLSNIVLKGIDPFQLILNLEDKTIVMSLYCVTGMRRRGNRKSVKKGVPKVNETYEIYMFRNATQNPGESLHSYCTRLRRLAQTCELTNEDEEIKSYIVVSCLSSRLRRRAL